MPYQNSFTIIKEKLFQENPSSALQQSINSINFTKWDWQYYSRGRSNFQENSTAALREVSELIDSAISKREGDQRKHTFLEKKIRHKRENGFTMNTQKYHITWWFVLWSNRLINFTKYYFMPQKFSMQCRKNITVEDNRKEWI